MIMHGFPLLYNVHYIESVLKLIPMFLIIQANIPIKINNSKLLYIYTIYIITHKNIPFSICCKLFFFVVSFFLLHDNYIKCIKKIDHLAAHSSMSAIQVLCTFCSWYFVNLISVLFLDLLCNDLHLHTSSLNFSQKKFCHTL